MKKLIAITLAAVLGLSILSGCGEEKPVPTPTPPSAQIATPSAKTDEVKEITIQASEWTGEGLELEALVFSGIYTGQLKNGVPNGVGRFDSVNDNGAAWSYHGEFANGTFHGKGATTWEDSAYKEVGTYVNGTFTPTTAELFDTYSAVATAEYKMSDVTKIFIDNHEDNFAASGLRAREDADALTDTSVSYSHLTKNVSNYREALFYCNSATAIQVLESYQSGHIITSVLAEDDYGQYYMLYNDGSLPDVFDNSYIEFYGLPIEASGFDNIGGGHTNVIVLISSIISVI